jgi:hypothetical protein
MRQAFDEGTSLDERRFYLYLVWARVLEGVGQREQARDVLREARVLLFRCADRITQRELRESFLNVPEHADVLAQTKELDVKESAQAHES